MDCESTATRLLTLLNVSAVKQLNSKHRLVGSEAPSAKLNKRRQLSPPPSTKTRQDVKPAPRSGNHAAIVADLVQDVPEIIADDDQDADKDPYALQFGAVSTRLTEVTRESVVAGRWAHKRMKLDQLGSVVVSQPEGATCEPVDYKKTVLGRLREPFERQQASYDNSLGKAVLSSLSTYTDFYHASVTLDAHAQFREAVGVHVMNHVHKIRRRILKNNERIAHAADTAAAEQPSVTAIQDQGFTRPSVLIVLPFRNSARTWLDALLTSIASYQVENHSRFQSEFSLPAAAVDKLAAAEPGTYPADHVDTFIGNVDDNFRVGVKLTRKTVKLFADFYASDLILASPLGLRLSIEKGSADFLSSIEILVMDQMDALTMQNWEHVQFVVSHLNQIPKDSHNTDFSRVKPWYLDGFAAYLRQSIFLSAYDTPEIRSMFNMALQNVAGKMRTENSSMPVNVPEGITQKFVKFECNSPQAVPDKRFEYFSTQILPSILKSAVQSVNTIIFVPSYFDLVRVHDHLKQLPDVSFAVLSEDSSNQDISRARQAFFAGNKSLLVMTERFHFFRRYKIRGIRNLVFYAPPDHAQFYTELLSFPFLDDGVEASDVTCRILYSKYDCMRLERIVGTSGLAELLDELLDE